MKLNSIVIGCLLCAGSLHGSILVLTTGLASPGFVQNFSTPALTPGSQNGVAGASVTNQFSNVTVSAGNANSVITSGLFYDPDGAGGCAIISNNNPTTIVNMAPNCVGNFVNNNATGSGLSVPNDPAGNPFSGSRGLPTINIGFVTGQTNVAFVLAAAGNGLNPEGAYPLNTLIQVYDKYGNLIDTQGIHTGFTAGSNGTNGTNWVTISETASIGSVVLSSTGQDETGQNSTATPTPWAAQVSSIEGNVSATPEPATMAMFGCGLVGIGLLARRRKG